MYINFRLKKTFGFKIASSVKKTQICTLELVDICSRSKCFLSDSTFLAVVSLKIF